MAKHKENAEMKEQRTPGELGYRMPAEWETHAGTWLGWPHELTDWPGKFAPIPWAFAEIVRHLSRSSGCICYWNRVRRRNGSGEF